MNHKTHKNSLINEVCQDPNLLIWSAVQPQAVSIVNGLYLVDHLFVCPKCSEAYEALCNVAEESDRENAEFHAMPAENSSFMTNQEALNNLWQRIDDKENQQRHESQFREASRRLHSIAMVAACVVVVALISLHALVTHDRYSSSIHPVSVKSNSLYKQASLTSTADMETLRAFSWSQGGPATLSFATLDYKLWQNENCEWFNHQFPWIFQIQEIITLKYGIHVDYIELLMVSGGLWQFDYDQNVPIGQTTAVCKPSSLYRITTYYKLPLDAFSTYLDTFKSTSNNDEYVYKSNSQQALHKWLQSILIALDSHKGIPSEIQLSLLQVGTYLNKTRTAAYLWNRDNLNVTANRSLILDDAAAFVDVTPLASVDKWLQRLESQGKASSALIWYGQQLLIFPNASSGCVQLPAAIRTELVQAIEELKPRSM